MRFLNTFAAGTVESSQRSLLRVRALELYVSQLSEVMDHGHRLSIGRYRKIDGSLY